MAPHPDDDILAAAGVINRAAGYEEVTVVFMTNGDINGISQGLLRQGEAVAAHVQNLGTVEDNLIFLGYPDGRLKEIFDSYTDPASQYFTPFGQGVTYGNRGLGRKDYHSYRFGSPATYNRPNIVTDLATILETYRPEQIFTPAEFDWHTDHATTYRLLRQALDVVRAKDTTYTPIVNRTIIWTPTRSTWPTLSDPVGFHTLMPYLSQTTFNWQDRVSLDVPLPMQDTNLLSNLKYKAIQAHASEFNKYDLFLQKWVHKDEIFWPENPFGSNKPPIVEAGADVFSLPGQYAQLNGAASRDPEGATLSYRWTQRAGTSVTLQNSSSATPGFTIPGNASAGNSWTFQLVVSDGVLSSASDMVHVFAGTRYLNIAPAATVAASSQNTSTNQQATKAVDNVADGSPGDATREWATQGEKSGAWIRLTWSTPRTVDRVVLYDRPNLNDQVLGGTLAFSDGSTVPVGAFSNIGLPVEVKFAARTVTSLTFNVTSTSGTTTSIGLAELRVYGDSSNRAPVLTQPGNQTGTVGVAVNLQIVASDADGDTLTYSATGLPAGLSINSSTGRISGTPTTAATSNVTVTASDGRGGSDSESFTWTVVPANVPPVLTNPGSQSSTVGVAVSLQIAATDANGDTLTYSATGLPAGLSINSGTGRISGTPTTAATSNVTVTVSDGRGGSGTANFTWAITRANVAPVLTEPQNQSSTVGVAVNLQIVASDADGDTLGYSASSLPAGLSISATTGRISGTPTTAGTSNVIVAVSDGRGGSDTAGFTWTVVPANVAPVLTNPGPQGGVVGLAVNLQLDATDSDGDTLTFSATGLPAGLSINSSTGRISGTPTAAGNSAVTVIVNDGRGGSDTESFAWSIEPANGNPVLTNPGNQSGTVGVPVSLQINANDADGDSLTYSSTGLPAGLAINSSTGRITGTPTAAAISNVTITVSDSRGGSDITSFTWTVVRANVAPVLTDPGNQSSMVGAAVSLQINATDADGDALGYAATGLPAGLSINASTGRISGTPTAAGTSNVTVAVSDGRGGSDATGFTWIVAPAPPVNTTPVLTNPGNQTGVVGVAVNLLISAADADGDPLGYAATGLPAGLTIDAKTGRISGTPITAGTSNVIVAVGDGRGGNDTASFTWTLAPANAPPLLTNPGTQSSTVGTAVNVQIMATDADGDILTYSVTGLPAGLSIDAGTGRIGGAPTAAGSSTVTVTVSDSRGGSDTLSFAWTVATANTAGGGGGGSLGSFGAFLLGLAGLVARRRRREDEYL